MANSIHFDKTDSLKSGLLLTFFLLLSVTHCKLISGESLDNHGPEVTATTPAAILSAVKFLHTQNEEITNIMGEAVALTSSGNNGDPSYCNSTKQDTCWEKVPTQPGAGIPSSKEQVDAACKAFDSGMECFDQWVKECLKAKTLRDKARESVIGAHETFTFLCQDEKFRNEYLRHSNCLRKISPFYDECSKRLVSDIKRTMAKNKDNSLNLCCIRLRFLQCVTEVANKHCSMGASNFVRTMAETLVRTEMRHHVPKECLTVTIHNCTTSKGSSFSLKMLKPSFFHTNFLPPTFDVIIICLIHLWVTKYHA